MIKITPVIIDESSNGRSIGMFLGLKEEIVEDELRRMASNGNGRFIDEEAGVVFSIKAVK